MSNIEENNFLYFFTKDELAEFEKFTIFGNNSCLVITKEYYFEIFCSKEENDLTIFWISNAKNAKNSYIEKNDFINLLYECTFEKCVEISVSL